MYKIINKYGERVRVITFVIVIIQEANFIRRKVDLNAVGEVPRTSRIWSSLPNLARATLLNTASARREGRVRPSSAVKGRRWRRRHANTRSDSARGPSVVAAAVTTTVRPTDRRRRRFRPRSTVVNRRRDTGYRHSVVCTWTCHTCLCPRTEQTRRARRPRSEPPRPSENNIISFSFSSTSLRFANRRRPRVCARTASEQTACGFLIFFSPGVDARKTVVFRFYFFFTVSFFKNRKTARHMRRGIYYYTGAGRITRSCRRLPEGDDDGTQHRDNRSYLHRRSNSSSRYRRCPAPLSAPRPLLSQ